ALDAPLPYSLTLLHLSYFTLSAQPLPSTLSLHDALPILPDTGEEDLSEDERAELRDRQDTRPRFEVLIVDETTEGGRDELHSDLLRLRTSSDQFIYDYVIVPTADDAVAAALTNPNLLACVIRPGFTDETREILSRDLRDAVEFAHRS